MSLLQVLQLRQLLEKEVGPNLDQTRHATSCMSSPPQDLHLGQPLVQHPASDLRLVDTRSCAAMAGRADSDKAQQSGLDNDHGQDQGDVQDRLEPATPPVDGPNPFLQEEDFNEDEESEAQDEDDEDVATGSQGHGTLPGPVTPAGVGSEAWPCALAGFGHL